MFVWGFGTIRQVQTLPLPQALGSVQSKSSSLLQHRLSGLVLKIFPTKTNPRPETLNPKSSASNPKPEALNPKL